MNGQAAQTLARARRLLDQPEGELAEPDLEVVHELIATVESRLEDSSDDPDWRTARAEHLEQLSRLRGRYEERAGALAATRDAIATLRDITSPMDILRAAPGLLSRCSSLDRAVLSLIRNGFLVAHAAHFRGDQRGAARALERLRGDPPRLEHPLLEAELLRRRRATIVTHTRVHPRVHRGMAETMAWDSYVAAPVVLGDVIAVLHADRPSGSALDVLDGDVVWAFANGVADAFESATLRRSLRTQRSELRDFVEWLAARSAELSDPSMELVPEYEASPGPPGSLDVIVSASRVDDRVVFEDLLTRRELDVLRLLARGDSNPGIAAQLVISPGTVKFHVGNILDKLRVSNRAEAVSRYHSLVARGVREGD